MSGGPKGIRVPGSMHVEVREKTGTYCSWHLKSLGGIPVEVMACADCSSLLVCKLCLYVLLWHSYQMLQQVRFWCWHGG